LGGTGLSWVQSWRRDGAVDGGGAGGSDDGRRVFGAWGFFWGNGGGGECGAALSVFVVGRWLLDLFVLGYEMNELLLPQDFILDSVFLY